MRNILKISLLFSYLAFTIGVTASAHYCGNKIVEIDLVSPISGQNHEDNCCSGSCSSNCCETVFTIFKIKDIHQSQDTWELKTNQIVLFVSHFSTDEIIDNLFKQSQIFNINHSPPDQPLFIKNCTFLI